MGTMKRAYLYVTRKKGKSILLFSILLAMATFVLTGLSIEKASRTAQQNLREAFGGEFEIVVDFTENNPYFRTLRDTEGNTDLYTELPVTQEVIDAIMTVNGIKSYDASTQTLVSTNLDIFPGNAPLKGELNFKVYARTVAGTENSSFFQSGTMDLIQGSHITGKESNVAVISKDLAEKNSLQLGDVISLQADAAVDVKIIGIYEILKPDPTFTSIVTYEKLENQIFIDIKTLQNLIPNTTAGFYSATFTVNDPAQLERILSEVKELSSVDWRAFQVATDNQAYLDAAAPLQELQTLVTTMIFVIALVSAIILSLVLTMWGRSRIHETGVFLSLGIGKIKIVSQYLAEILMIAVVAFGFSYFTSSALTNQLADKLLRQEVSGKEQIAEGVTVVKKEGFHEDVSISIKDNSALSDAAAPQENNPEDEGSGVEISTVEADNNTQTLHITVSAYNMVQLYLIGILIITLSTGISSLATMRLKPREILSKMS